MRLFIKFILLVAITLFALSNYRLFNFGSGCSRSSINSDNSFKETFIEALSVEKIEYYKRTLPYGDYIYRVYLETDNSGYLLNATAEDIAAIRLIGQTGIIEVSEIIIVPFYVEIIIGFIILIIPFGSRRKEENVVSVQPKPPAQSVSHGVEYSSDILKKLNDLSPESRELVEQVIDKLSDKNNNSDMGKKDK